MPNRIFASSVWVILLSLIFAVLSFPVMARAWFDYLHNGSGWRQGDWLINLGSGFVRRGIMGDGFIMVSDMTGVPLLVLVQAVQIALFVAVVGVVWVIGCLHPNRPLLLFLAASSGFLVIFWAGDPPGTMRKELLGLLAMALLVLSQIRDRPAAIWAVLAVVLYTLGCIGNILHAFMLPAFVVGLYLLSEGGQISGRLFRILAAVSVAMCLFWLGIAVVFRDVPDLAGMCDPLLARGLDAGFCQGALLWTVAGEVDHIDQLMLKMKSAAVLHHLVAATLLLVPVALSFSVFRERRVLALLALLTFVPLLPLYAVATDWGRWLSISYSAYVFLLLQAHATGRVTIAKLPPMQLTLALLLIAVLMSPEHGIDWKPGGAAREVISAALAFR